MIVCSNYDSEGYMNINHYALITAVSGLALLFLADGLSGFGVETIAKMFTDTIGLYY